jgi:hypothetical protein
VDAATVPDPEALLGAFELEVATLASIGTLGTLAGVAGVAGRRAPRGRSAPGPSR